MKTIGSVHVDRTVMCLELLASRPRTVAELSAAIGGHPRTMRRTLNRLAELGYVVRSPLRGTMFMRTARFGAIGIVSNPGQDQSHTV